MIVGTTIFHDGTGTTAYYSVPFAREGQAAVFVVDVTHKSGSPTMVIGVEHKNGDEPSWTELGTFSSITAVGIATKDLGSIREEVRFSFKFSAGSAGDFMHVVLSAPAWRWYD